MAHILLGSKRQHEIQNTKRLKKGRSYEPNKVRHVDGSSRANDYQPQEATSTTWKESASSRAFRSERGRHKSAEFDHYQVPVYPLYASNRQIPYQCQVNSQSRNEPSEIFYHERGLNPNITGFPPFRPRVGEFTSRAHVFSDNHHAHTNRYNFEMKNLNAEHIDRPLYVSPRDRYGWRK